MTKEQIDQELAALPDPLDIPPRQLDQYETRRSMLRARAETIRRAESTLTDVDPQIAALTKWLGHLVSWRKTLCDRLLVCPPQKQNALKLSVMRIDRDLDLMGEMLPGRLPLDELMAEAGYVPSSPVARANGQAWFGCMPYVEERLKELQARHDDAQGRLDSALRDS